MLIRIGYDIELAVATPMAMIYLLRVHPSRRDDLETPDWLRTDPPLDVVQYFDTFGNICSRVTAPAGTLTLSADFIIRDPGLIDAYAPEAEQHAVQDLPNEVVVFLLGSRYCETDRMSETAWSLFQGTRPGWERVQAICDYVHNHITFDHAHARPTKTAYDAWVEKAGVCRDYAHLAVTFCRCMNIPARYCTGYLGDIGVPVVGEMDFSAWFEVYLGGRWYVFDARNNIPRIGRILMARGRDATDVAMVTSFGPCTLVNFKVVTDEVVETAAA